jgi:hypothetical protein
MTMGVDFALNLCQFVGAKMCDLTWNRPMKSTIDIDGHKAAISFDRSIGLFRGEFIGLTGGADFYAASIELLIVEGHKSLKVFLEVCAENDIDPQKLPMPEEERAAKLDALREDIAEGITSGESEPLDIVAVKREARTAAGI